MILLIDFMCCLAISATVGVRSSRSHRNVDWVSVFLAVLISVILVLLGGFVLQSWIDWKSLDNRQQSAIASGRVTK